MKDNKGFTLMEMMMVIAIIAILAGIAIPGIMQWRSRSALGGAARNIVSDIGVARSRAVKDNDTVTITFNVANNSYNIVAADGTTLKNNKLTGVIIKNTSLAGNTATISGRGRCTPTGTITLKDPQDKKEIVITLRITGNAKVAAAQDV